MKYVKVGNICVALDSKRVLIDKTWTEGKQTYNRQIELELGELLDLQVALDGVSNDVPPSENESMLLKIRRVLQETEHKLYALGIRHRIEVHVETRTLYSLARNDTPIVKARPDTEEVTLGGYGKIVAQRGRRV